MNLNRVPHIVWALVALVMLLSAWAAFHNPKLLELAGVIVGAIATLARTDIPPGSEE